SSKAKSSKAKSSTGVYSEEVHENYPEKMINDDDVVMTEKSVAYKPDVNSDEKEEKYSKDNYGTDDVEMTESSNMLINSDFPGVNQNENIETCLTALVMQHLQTIKSAFPEAYYKANINKEHVMGHFFPILSDYKDSDDDDDELNDNAPAVSHKITRELLDIPKRGREGTSRRNIRKNEAGGVQIRMAKNGRTIEQVLINSADRPEGLFKSADKKHSTAWIVFVRGAQRAVLGKTREDAYEAINDLLDESEKLPGNKKVFSLEPTVKERFDGAMNEVHKAQDLNEVEISINSLQIYIRAYLKFRNFIPLSVADTDSVGPGGTGEGSLIAILDSPEDTSDEVLLDAIYGLLDFGVVLAYLNGKG
ncbi:MAG: hypothetical protein ACRC3B_02920, partial [Bacteroidia bacterium]